MRYLKTYTKLFETIDNLKGWNCEDGIKQSINKEFNFTSFIEAKDFIDKVSDLSELENHHPKIEWMFNKIILTLSTHDAGDIVTEKDIKLANLINSIYENN